MMPSVRHQAAPVSVKIQPFSGNRLPLAISVALSRSSAWIILRASEESVT